MKNSAAFYVIIAMMAAMAVILAACGGGDGGMDPYVVQELSLDVRGAPHVPVFDNLAWDGTKFWAHSITGTYDSLIYAFATTGNQITSIQNPLYPNYRIRSLEYGDGSLWALALLLNSPTIDVFVFEIDTMGSVASSFPISAFYRWGIAYADSLIWVPAESGASTSNDVARYDPGTGTPVVPALTLSSAVTDIRGFCGGGGYFWLLDAAPGSGIHKYDTTTGSEVDYIELSQFGNGITWDGSYLWISRAPARIDAYDFQ